LAGLQTGGLLIRPAKTSYTAGTLCAMRLAKWLYVLSMMIKKVINSIDNKIFSENMRTFFYTKRGYFFIKNLRHTL
jgi:hypothetical protein